MRCWILSHKNLDQDSAKMVWKSCNKEISALRSWLYSVLLSVSSADLQLRIWLSQAPNRYDPLAPTMSFFYTTVCEYHLFFFLFFCSYYQETLAGCLRVYSAFLFQPKRDDFIFAVTLLSLQLPHFVRPERQPPLCYQGKVHLFRVSSSYGGFWASKSQSVFLTLCFFSVSWESVKYCIHTVHCTVQIEHL